MSNMTWVLKQTNTEISQLADVIWVRELGLFVAAGGGIFTSPDGKMWTKRHTAGHHVCWSPERGELCAVSGGTFYTSADGITWKQSITTAISVRTFQSVCWSPELNMYAAIADSQTSGYNVYIYTSPDAVTWTSRYSSSGGGSLNVGRAGGILWSSKYGRFVAIARIAATNYAARITSTNGTSWTASGLTGATTPTGLGFPQQFTFNDEQDIWIACYTTSIYKSPDGLSYTAAITGLPGNSATGCCYAEELGVFVVVGYNTSSRGVFRVSTDAGETWTLTQTNNIISYIRAVCWSPELNIFVAVGYTTGNYGMFYICDPADKLGKIYVGVNGVSRKVTSMYAGIDGVARKVTKILTGTGNG